MGKRNRYAKNKKVTFPSSTETFTVGELVRVKVGVKDPDYGSDLGGLQGRVTNVETSEDEKALVTFQWDSLSLKAMPTSHIRRCEEDGLDWTLMVLDAAELEKVDPRDTQKEVDALLDQLETEHAWDHLGKQGQRIRQALGGVDEADDLEAFKAWLKYLEKHVKLPFVAEVAEFQERGPLQAGDRVNVTGFAGAEDMYGVLVHVQAKREGHVFPLCDLEAVEKKSTNHALVDDYAVWFANR